MGAICEGEPGVPTGRSSALRRGDMA